MIEVPALLQRVIIDVSGFTAASQASDTFVNKVGSGFSSVSQSINKSVAVPLIALGGFAIASARSVDEANRSIQRETGATGKSLEGLQKSFQNVAGNVPESFEQVSQALIKVHQRTDATGPALETLTKRFLDLERITGEHLDFSKIQLALTAFGISARQMPGILDELYRASVKTGLPIARMVQLLQIGGPAFRQFGLDAGQSAALLGLFEKAGIPATQAVVALRREMAKAAADGKAPKEALAEFIVKIQELTKEGKTAEAIALGTKLFGPRGQTLVEALANGRLSLADFNNALSKTGPSIESVAFQTLSFSEQMKIFKNQSELALAPIGGILLPRILDAFKTLLPPIIDAVKWFSQLPEPIVDVGLALGVGAIFVGKYGQGLQALFSIVNGGIDLLKRFAIAAATRIGGGAVAGAAEAAAGAGAAGAAAAGGGAPAVQDVTGAVGGTVSGVQSTAQLARTFSHKEVDLYGNSLKDVARGEALAGEAAAEAAIKVDALNTSQASGAATTLASTGQVGRLAAAEKNLAEVGPVIAAAQIRVAETAAAAQAAQRALSQAVYEATFGAGAESAAQGDLAAANALVEESDANLVVAKQALTDAQAEVALGANAGVGAQARLAAAQQGATDAEAESIAAKELQVAAQTEVNAEAAAAVLADNLLVSANERVAVTAAAVTDAEGALGLARADAAAAGVTEADADVTVMAAEENLLRTKREALVATQAQATAEVEAMDAMVASSAAKERIAAANQKVTATAFEASVAEGTLTAAEDTAAVSGALAFGALSGAATIGIVGGVLAVAGAFVFAASALGAFDSVQTQAVSNAKAWTDLEIKAIVNNNNTKESYKQLTEKLRENELAHKTLIDVRDSYQKKSGTLSLSESAYSDEILKTNDALNANTTRHDEIRGALDKLGPEYDKIIKKEKEHAAELKDSKAKLEDTATSLGITIPQGAAAAAVGLDLDTKAVQALRKELPGATAVFGEFATQALVNAGVVSGGLKALETDAGKFKSTIEGSVASFTDLFSHDFSSAPVAQVKVSEQAFEDFFLSSQQQARDWAQGITDVMGRGVDVGIVQQLAEAGPKSQPQLDALNAMIDLHGIDWVNSELKHTQEVLQVTEDAFNAKIALAAIKEAEYNLVVKAAQDAERDNNTEHLDKLAQSTDQHLALIAYLTSIHWHEIHDIVSQPFPPLVLTVEEVGLQHAADLLSFITGVPIHNLGFVISAVNAAEGGIFDPKPGGHIIRIAESGYREVVLPTDDPKRSWDLLVASGLIPKLEPWMAPKGAIALPTALAPSTEDALDKPTPGFTVTPAIAKKLATYGGMKGDLGGVSPPADVWASGGPLGASALPSNLGWVTDAIAKKLAAYGGIKGDLGNVSPPADVLASGMSAFAATAHEPPAVSVHSTQSVTIGATTLMVEHVHGVEDLEGVFGKLADERDRKLAEGMRTFQT